MLEEKSVGCSTAYELMRAKGDGSTALRDAAAVAGERRGGRFGASGRDAAIGCLRERYCRRGAVAGQRRCRPRKDRSSTPARHLLLERPHRRNNGAEVDQLEDEDAAVHRTPLFWTPARRATSTRRGCCWRKARRSTGRGRTVRRRYSSPVRMPAVLRWTSDWLGRLERRRGAD